MKKRLPVLLLALVMVFSISIAAFGCKEKQELGGTSGGKVLRIACWNDEFQSRFRAYYPEWKQTNSDGTDTLKDGTKVEWIITPNDNNGYQNALDQALLQQSTRNAEDRIDIFLIEADYAMKYINSDMALELKSGIGLKDSDLDDQYAYTQKIVTNNRNELKGTSWQAAPGLFAYRRSYAKEVLGVSEPADVQAKLDSWDKFDEVAAQMKAKDYFMLSGFDDSYRVFSNNVTAPWVNENSEIKIDTSIEKWITQTKTYTENGYNNQTSLWDTAWADGQRTGVFGYFLSTWGFPFVLDGNSGGKDHPYNPEDPTAYSYGDWAACLGPQSYYWGGTWICGAKGTDNIDIVKDVMLKLTCDDKIMEKITREQNDYTNNKTAMTRLANDTTYGSALLGGQNHIALLGEQANAIDMKNLSAYDQGCNENIQDAFTEYFQEVVIEGKLYDEAQAYDEFFNLVHEVYPELKRGF